MFFVDGIWLKRTRGHEVESVSVLVAISVNQVGYREILGDAEGTVKSLKRVGIYEESGPRS